MYSSITLIHSSPLIFRPGSTKCNAGAVSRAHMIPETIVPRVVGVCDAVNRSGVSSSSRASVFEVLPCCPTASHGNTLHAPRRK